MKRNLLPTLLLLLGAALQANAQVVVSGITEKVRDIVPGTSGGGMPRHLYNFNNHIYFSAVNADGRELWATDGTMAGTDLIKDLNPGIDFSSPRGFTVMDGNLYFVATNGSAIQLWKTDGTPVNTEQVSAVDIMHSIFPYNSSLLFAGLGNNGSELWISDGTNSGTQELLDLNPGIDDSYPTSFTRLGSKVVFAAFADASMATYAPWITDGTPGGTVKLANVSVLSLAPLLYEYNSRQHSDFCEYNGEVYFAGDNGTGDFELWKTDGTPSGTVLVKDLSSGSSLPQAFKVYNGKLYFSVNIGSSAVDGLWVSSGTAATTTRLKGGIVMGDGDVVEYAELNNDLYFIASGKVWVTDGTISGTHAMLNSPANPTRLTKLGNKLFCFGTSTVAPNQFTLFSIDDLGNIFPVSAPFSITSLPYIHTDTMGNSLYFGIALQTDATDIELWRYKDTTFTIGVNDVASKATAAIYPNPATNSFSVKLPDNKNTMVYVYSLSGQLLVQSAKTENIDISQLPAGIYTVQIINDGKVSVGKLRKE